MIWEMYFWIVIFYLVGGILLYYGIKKRIKKIWITGLILVLAATRVLSIIRLIEG